MPSPRNASLGFILTAVLLAACGPPPTIQVITPTSLGPAQSATPVIGGLPSEPASQTGTPPPAAPTSVLATPARVTPTPRMRPSPTPAPGWVEVVVPQDSYALRLPPTWLPLPLDGQSPEAALDQIGADNPVLALSLSHSLPEGVLDTLSLIAFDSLEAAGDAAFVSAIRIGPAPFASADEAATHRSEVVEADPMATLLSDLPTSVGFEARAGRALHYTTTFPPDAPQVTVYHTQIYVDNGHGKVLVILLSAEGSLHEGYERLFELVLDTLYFSPSN